MRHRTDLPGRFVFSAFHAGGRSQRHELPTPEGLGGDVGDERGGAADLGDVAGGSARK